MTTRDDIQIGQVVQVKLYNQLAEKKWSKRFEEAHKNNQPKPNLCFYVFTDKKGNYRTRGFVKRTHNDGWNYYKTKREALKN